jgi:hypothetical protein
MDSIVVCEISVFLWSEWCPTRRRFPRRRVVVYGIDHQWKADLVDLAKLSSYNKGFKYLLTCIDFVVSTSVLKVDPVLDFFLSVSWFFWEYGLIGDGLCCRLRDLGVFVVWVMYLQRSSWPIKFCETFASSTTKFWKAYQKQWRPRYNSCWKKWRAVPTLAGTRKGNWNTREKPFKEATWWI